MIDHQRERLGLSLEHYLEALGCDCSAQLAICWDGVGHVQIDVVHESNCAADRETVR